MSVSEVIEQTPHERGENGYPGDVPLRAMSARIGCIEDTDGGQKQGHGENEGG